MRHLAAAAALVGLVALTGCRDHTVRLDARPAAGDRATYRVAVRAVTETSLQDRAPTRAVADSVFEATHEVLQVGPTGSLVRVRLRQEGGRTTALVVRLDRAGQLASVQSIDALPAEALGDLGLSEIFPAAAAAPPQHPLAPGDRWAIDEPVAVGGLGPSRLVGSGRLARLGVAGGRNLATVETTYRLPVLRSQLETGGRLALSGDQETTATVTYELADGTVHAAHASTRGTYRIALFPPIGTVGDPVPGTMRVRVRSTTRRLR